MTTEKILLRPDEGDKVTLTTYISYDHAELKMPPRPAILVIPGGGYTWCSEREAEPIAKVFFAAGFNCFILRYSVGADAVAPRPLVEASRAIVHIRENAEKYNVNPDRVFVVGFSAGGHLAASIGTLWHEDFAKAYPDMPAGMNRPTGMLLSYPVITSGPFAHRGSFDNILGERKDDEDARRELSLEYRVTEKTVPCFIWSTRPDRTVPIQNSILFAEALANAGVPFEMHVYPMGWHGTSLATPPVGVDFPAISAWSADALRWMNSFK